MAKKLDLSLVSEMTWSECVLNAAKHRTKTITTWICVNCSEVLSHYHTGNNEEDANRYLAEGWVYIRVKKGFAAKCKDCRNVRKATPTHAENFHHQTI